MILARLFATAALAAGWIGSPLAAQEASRAVYLELATAACERGIVEVPAIVERWRSAYDPDPVWGYGAPAEPVWQARLAGGLFELSGEERYAREAARWLAGHREFKALYPEELRQARPEYRSGLPTLTDFFQVPFYCRAWLAIRASPAVSAGQRAAIEQSIAECADFVVRTHEWGPMNRAMLRAEGLELAACALPEHPHAGRWRKLSRILWLDSRARWQEEDAQIYHPVWLCSLIRYADLLGDTAYFRSPVVAYYFEYYLHLLSPAGMVPPFGDARWNENWTNYLGCLERGAREYRRADLKWGAQRIFEAMKTRPIGVRQGMKLLDAYHWCDDSLGAQAPPARSEEVLEDLVGKKIAFRDGWGPAATFLLLNYRDEGPFARVPRDYLRHTIPVEEEKMHHGHSDENSIPLLMSGGSVLLGHPGYRTAIPSGPDGEYRADYFHNRLVARTGKPGREQPLFEFLRGSGAYRPVASEKIEFFTSTEVDYARTRVTDRRTGIEHDRAIAFLKPEGIFLVFDIVRALEDEYLTLATLWHAQRVETLAAQRYATAIDAVRGEATGREYGLGVAFLQGAGRRSGTFPIERGLQRETALYQMRTSHYRTGRFQTFITALVPHRRAGQTGLAARLQGLQLLAVEDPGAGLGVAIERAGLTRFVCVKVDLEREVLTANRRPRYTYESGRVHYGPFETDASFLYARRSGAELYWAATHLVKVRFEERELFAAGQNSFTMQPDDLSTAYGVPKWRFWEDRVELR